MHNLTFTTKTHKFRHWTGTVFTKSCSFSLSWKTTCFERPQRSAVALYRFYCTIHFRYITGEYCTGVGSSTTAGEAEPRPDFELRKMSHSSPLQVRWERGTETYREYNSTRSSNKFQWQGFPFQWFNKDHKQCLLSLVVNSGITDLASNLGTNGLVKQNNFINIVTTKLVKSMKNWNIIVSFCYIHMSLFSSYSFRAIF